VVGPQLVIPGHLGPVTICLGSSSLVCSDNVSVRGDILDDEIESLIQKFRRLSLEPSD
jgi:hypothetical protein